MLANLVYIYAGKSEPSVVHSTACNPLTISFEVFDSLSGFAAFENKAFIKVPMFSLANNIFVPLSSKMHWYLSGQNKG